MGLCSIAFVLFCAAVGCCFLKKFYLSLGIPNLRGKHVLVTGGSSGIGKATAIEAAKRGAHVTIVARDKAKLLAAFQDIKKEVKYPDQEIQTLSLDVCNGLANTDNALRGVEDTTGPVFLLVNCAGTAVCGEFEKTTEADFRHMMDLNYFGTVFPTISIAKRMKERKEGHIVITGSQATLLGIYGMSAYCSSKFALRGFAESLHMELKPYNVSVTMCLPPDTNTPGFENEEKSKPEVTRLISETAGLFQPEAVARQLLADALRKTFFSTVGFEAFILTNLCAGMSPIGCWADVVFQISLMSLLRAVSVGYLFNFQRVISKYVKSNEMKNSRKAQLMGVRLCRNLEGNKQFAVTL